MQTMSQPFKVLVNSTDALESFASEWQGPSRTLLEGQESGLLIQAQGGASDAHQQKRDRLDAMASSFEDDSVSLTFPSGTSVLSDPSPLIDQVDHLLLFEDASRFQKIGVVATRKNYFRETW